MEWICKECGSYNDGSDQRCSVCGAARPKDAQCACPECKSTQWAFPGMRCAKCGRLFDETDFSSRRGDDTVLSDYGSANDNGEDKSSGYKKYVSERISNYTPDDPDNDEEGQTAPVKKPYVRMIVALVLLAAAVVVPVVLFIQTNSTAGTKTAVSATAAVPVDLSTLKTGELIEFGSYPQSEVKDEATRSELNKLPFSPVSYGYYSGTGSEGSGQPFAYMTYADVTYDGNKYRAVEFTSYRPFRTYETHLADYSWQDNNGYFTDTVYWFEFEPIVWKVLDPDKGLLMTEKIIDSQPFENDIFEYNNKYYGDADHKHYASDWAYSSLRGWLNGGFFDTAFGDGEKGVVLATELKTPSGGSSDYDAGDTTDNVFLLSREDVLNPSYGFSESEGAFSGRTAFGTDYAKCQGLCVSSGGASYWRLRTPSLSSYTDNVYYDGYVYYSFNTYGTYYGVRAALYINLQSAAAQSLITAHQG